jgi:hypothetical protein
MPRATDPDYTLYLDLLISDTAGLIELNFNTFYQYEEPPFITSSSKAPLFTKSRTKNFPSVRAHSIKVKGKISYERGGLYNSSMIHLYFCSIT